MDAHIIYRDVTCSECRRRTGGDCGRHRDLDAPIMRTFSTGATRGTDSGKPDYEGYLSPMALVRFGEYMTAHRVQADGAIRESDNWQKGIPRDQYIKSAFRHFVTWWVLHRSGVANEALEEALCAVWFNVQGYLHETLKAPGGRDQTPTTGHCSPRDLWPYPRWGE